MRRNVMRLFLLVTVLSLTLSLVGQTATSTTPQKGQPTTTISQAASLPGPILLAQTNPQGNPNVKVWVNTSSGVYHCPGTRWYGNTKHGQYMTQAEAQKAGYRPAYGKVCQ